MLVQGKQDVISSQGKENWLLNLQMHFRKYITKTPVTLLKFKVCTVTTADLNQHNTSISNMSTSFTATVILYRFWDKSKKTCKYVNNNIKSECYLISTQSTCPLSVSSFTVILQNPPPQGPCLYHSVTWNHIHTFNERQIISQFP